VDETQVIVVAAVVAAVAAVLASAVGAGGAILAQMLSVRATDKASAKRFAWEQQQAIRREKADRDAVFAEAKREIFAKFLAGHYQFRADLYEAWELDDRSAQGEAVTLAFNKYIDEVGPLQSEIALIAPQLAEVSGAVWNKGSQIVPSFFRELEQATPSYVVRREKLNEYGDVTRACQKAMAAHLQGESIPEA
jgi:hypothetical protein